MKKNIDLNQWNNLTLEAKRDYINSLKLPSVFKFKDIRTCQQMFLKHDMAFFDGPGGEFVFIPGGYVELGLKQKRRDFHPWRRVELRPYLIEVHPQNTYETHEKAKQALQQNDDGLFSLASIDEWEFACRGGSSRLFRWGNDHPLAEDPAGSRESPDFFDHKDPNAFGLILPYNTYEWEYCQDAGMMLGGDGGTSISGPARPYHAWRTLASAYRCVSWTVRDPAQEVRHGLARRVYRIAHHPCELVSGYETAAWDKWYAGSEYEELLFFPTSSVTPKDLPPAPAHTKFLFEKAKPRKTDLFRIFRQGWLKERFLKALAQGDSLWQEVARSLEADQVCFVEHGQILKLLKGYHKAFIKGEALSSSQREDLDLTVGFQELELHLEEIHGETMDLWLVLEKTSL